MYLDVYIHTYVCVYFYAWVQNFNTTIYWFQHSVYEAKIAVVFVMFIIKYRNFKKKKKKKTKEKGRDVSDIDSSTVFDFCCCIYFTAHIYNN